MLDFSVDREGLSAAIAEAGGERYRLTPLGATCTYPVFRGDAAGAPPAFVKVGTADEWRRTANLLRDAGACGLFPRMLPGSMVDYNGHAVFVMEWREAKVVYPEDMTERQVDGLVDACVRLSAALQAVRDFEPVAGSPLEPERMYEDVASYVRRHPVAGRLIEGLVSIPAEERTFGDSPLAVVHGDFHAKNFGFSGDEFACVFDFDKLTQGLACSDLANAIVERFSCLVGWARRRVVPLRARRGRAGTSSSPATSCGSSSPRGGFASIRIPHGSRSTFSAATGASARS